MGRAIRRFMLSTALPLVVSTSAHAAVCHASPVHHARTHKVALHTAAGLGVVIDQARLIAFPKPVKTVYVANPTVVDITMVDSQHAFLLGKTFGMTNMIALAPDGGQISNQQVTVTNNAAAVTVNRGADQFDYMCTRSHCETAPRPGDPNGFVTNTEGAATTHEGAGLSGGNSAPAAQTASAQ